MTELRKKLCVNFVHLDLGVGGAEQLVVHAAKGLQERGHAVTIYTSYHDRGRSLAGDLKVVEFGRWIPRTVFGKLTALCSILRVLWVSLRMYCVEENTIDVVINDQVSAINPLLKQMSRKVIFYCHFPDLLLCTKRDSAVRRLYRWFFDWYEEVTTGMCDTIVVNSRFTREVFLKTFNSLRGKMEPQVLYPPVDLAAVSSMLYKVVDLKHSDFRELDGLPTNTPFFLSLNRYERKKNLKLAIESFAQLMKCKNEGKVCDRWPDPLLIIAGGFDNRVGENKAYYDELTRFAHNDCLWTANRVCFLKSISNDLRWYLLYNALAVIYTPWEEHFGMVPCESMAVGTTVIASNSGGPRESIKNNVTGYLCDYTTESFARAMRKTMDLKYSNSQALQTMKDECVKRVRDKFRLGIAWFPDNVQRLSPLLSRFSAVLRHVHHATERDRMFSVTVFGINHFLYYRYAQNINNFDTYRLLTKLLWHKPILPLESLAEFVKENQIKLFFKKL